MQGGKKLKMEQLKLNGFSKFVAFLLIAVIIISVVVFAAKGNEAPQNQPESGKVGTLSDKTDENKDGNDKNSTDDSPPPSTDTGNGESDTPSDENGTVPEKPIILNKLTGLEIAESELTSTAFGVIIDPSSPTYGLSFADIAIEFPTETGDSRMLVYSSDKETIWKIGSLLPTRKYISSVAGHFGGIIVGYGSDDKISYTMGNSSSELDISKHSDCYYVENESYIYTNENLITIAHNRTHLSSALHPYKDAPFAFSSGIYSAGIGGAESIVIPFSETNKTAFSYNSSTGEYNYGKNGSICIDMLSGDEISYTNVFILFANSTTYENASASQLVIDTDGGGKGYYFTKGKLTEFVWSVNEKGELQFKNLMGNVLEVNTGSSYIAYYKASASANIIKKVG